jgi:hypothetical protein
MSNVIDFLERMGQDAGLRHTSGAQLEEALARAAISPELQAAITAGDQKRIQALLGIQANICSIIFPVDTDEKAARFLGESRSLAVSVR